VDQGIEFARRLGLDPVIELTRPGVASTDGDAPAPVRRSIRNPLTLSETPPAYTLPPPDLDEHGDDVRAWLKEPRP
jgi:crotonobetainyl-CoA:carnitine CoA-transferase CaiB-like acyl-CoA transferase